MKRFSLYFLSSFVLLLSAVGQEDQPEQSFTDKIKISGYLDFYFAYDFAEPDNNQRQYVTQAARHDEFNFNLALLRADFEDDNFRATLALQAGTYPLINYAEPTVLGQIINQANIGVRVGQNSWIDVGIMGGHFGYESFRTIDNEVYTQALVTEYTPYYQTGIQYSNQLSEAVTVRAVVVNGWQNIYETNNAKAFGLAVDYSLSENIVLGYGNYFGNEPGVIDPDIDETRLHNSIYGKYEQDAFSIMANLDITIQNSESAVEYDPVVFATVTGLYRLSEKVNFGGRYEFVADNSGILIAPGFSSNILTGSFNYSIFPNTMARAEARLFFGDEPIWNVDNGSQFNNQVLSFSLATKF
jgi:hypothetical protein